MRAIRDPVLRSHTPPLVEFPITTAGNVRTMNVQYWRRIARERSASQNPTCPRCGRIQVPRSQQRRSADDEEMATSGGTTKEEKKRETYHGPQWTGAAAAVGWDNPLGLVRGRSLGWDRVLSSVWPAKEGDDVEGAPAGSSTSTARALLAPLSLSFSR